MEIYTQIWREIAQLCMRFTLLDLDKCSARMGSGELKVYRWGDGGIFVERSTSQYRCVYPIYTRNLERMLAEYMESAGKDTVYMYLPHHLPHMRRMSTDEDIARYMRERGFEMTVPSTRYTRAGGSVPEMCSEWRRVYNGYQSEYDVSIPVLNKGDIEVSKLEMILKFFFEG